MTLRDPSSSGSLGHSRYHFPAPPSLMPPIPGSPDLPSFPDGSKPERPECPRRGASELGPAGPRSLPLAVPGAAALVPAGSAVGPPPSPAGLVRGRGRSSLARNPPALARGRSGQPRLTPGKLREGEQPPLGGPQAPPPAPRAAAGGPPPTLAAPRSVHPAARPSPPPGTPSAQNDGLSGCGGASSAWGK